MIQYLEGRFEFQAEYTDTNKKTQKKIFHIQKASKPEHNPSNSIAFSTKSSCNSSNNLNKITKINSRWTEDEDILLTLLIQSEQFTRWREIALRIPLKTTFQCKYRWTKILKPGLKKGPWTKEEDEILLAFVKQQGSRNFQHASKLLNGRSPKQCYERYINALNPKVKKGDWTIDEDYMIFLLFSHHGGRWTKFTRFFNEKRSENSLKNRFYSFLRKYKRKNKELDHSDEVITKELLIKFERLFKLKNSLISNDQIEKFLFTNFGYYQGLDLDEQTLERSQTNQVALSNDSSSTQERLTQAEEKLKPSQSIFSIAKSLPASNNNIQNVDLLFDLLLRQQVSSFNSFTNEEDTTKNSPMDFPLGFARTFECFEDI